MPRPSSPPQSSRTVQDLLDRQRQYQSAARTDARALPIVPVRAAQRVCVDVA